MDRCLIEQSSKILRIIHPIGGYRSVLCIILSTLSFTFFLIKYWVKYMNVLPEKYYYIFKNLDGAFCLGPE